MALANHRVRTFKNISELEQFIRTEAALLTVVNILTDDNGTFILVYTV